MGRVVAMGLGEIGKEVVRGTGRCVGRERDRAERGRWDESRGKREVT